MSELQDARREGSGSGSGHGSALALSSALDTVARAQAAVHQPGALFGALDAALFSVMGHRLFTILAWDPGTGAATRLYSSQPQAYPACGRKTLAPGLWTHAVLERGEPYIGYTQQDIEAVFSDHSLIAALGCQSVLNMPVRWAGRTVGSLNLLHAAHWYGPGDVAVCRPFAQLALPALIPALPR